MVTIQSYISHKYYNHFETIDVSFDPVICQESVITYITTLFDHQPYLVTSDHVLKIARKNIINTLAAINETSRALLSGKKAAWWRASFAAPICFLSRIRKQQSWWVNAAHGRSQQFRWWRHSQRFSTAPHLKHGLNAQNTPQQSYFLFPFLLIPK